MLLPIELSVGLQLDAFQQHSCCVCTSENSLRRQSNMLYSWTLCNPCEDLVYVYMCMFMYMYMHMFIYMYMCMYMYIYI